MSDLKSQIPTASVDDLYAESGHWHVNTGEETIHAKRMPGKWRRYKWWASLVWLVFFFGPYLRWDGRQAVLFDIPERQFHLFGVTILPQDFWMLSLLLLFFAILLAVVTAVAGRVWCGFFCFQTVWTDVYTLIEEKLEGPPPKRRKLEQAPWDAAKARTKLAKHSLWLLIALFTGISFVAWFNDAYRLWGELLTFDLGMVALVFIALFTGGTYLLAGFMREQVCLWLCPYARIQGVMIDKTTVVPTYDLNRGEPRGRIKKGEPEDRRSTGDCIDCNQCVAVCPTGVDIRQGQQEGCITCALCIDACDSVMEKVGRPLGLIRYESLEGLESGSCVPVARRPRVWVYTLILLASLSGIVWGLSTLGSIDLKVIHSRQPLFVLQSDGSIQNKYTLKVLNKTPADLPVRITASGPEGLVLVGDEVLVTEHGGLVARDVFVRVPQAKLDRESQPISFVVTGQDSQGQVYRGERTSVFIAPPSVVRN
ncbi:cytochrome c oxidase accessory protein CcoG [Motiliproteus sp. SC1-56]|uniref:cytochrome c oxidase accessory protein CcoG n=1 Tax=Motiliproteus sp. SC1-56 TaxID=2799565 RepID=UPI001A8CAB05|nr:cytochrome c oxidase accessory protein CcoG [Motiliproteus sp. SC1-56]